MWTMRRTPAYSSCGAAPASWASCAGRLKFACTLLEDDSAEPQYLLTEPGVGYRLADAPGEA